MWLATVTCVLATIRGCWDHGWCREHCEETASTRSETRSGGVGAKWADVKLIIEA